MTSNMTSTITSYKCLLQQYLDPIAPRATEGSSRRAGAMQRPNTSFDSLLRPTLGVIVGDLGYEIGALLRPAPAAG